MSLLILVVDDEPDVETLFRSNSAATYALAGSRWNLRNPLQARSSASLMLLEYHSY